VITFDRPGNGRSERSADPEAYGWLRWRSGPAVMDAAGTDRAVLVSLSQGALESLKLAADHRHGPAAPRSPRPHARQRPVRPRPAELDCRMESGCETCAYFRTGVDSNNQALDHWGCPPFKDTPASPVRARDLSCRVLSDGSEPEYTVAAEVGSGRVYVGAVQVSFYDSVPNQVFSPCFSARMSRSPPLGRGSPSCQCRQQTSALAHSRPAVPHLRGAKL
jgi:hypothetical protein